MCVRGNLDGDAIGARFHKAALALPTLAKKHQGSHSWEPRQARTLRDDRPHIVDEAHVEHAVGPRRVQKSRRH